MLYLYIYASDFKFLQTWNSTYQFRTNIYLCSILFLVLPYVKYAIQNTMLDYIIEGQ
jgi:hypothetical protein